MLAFDPGDPDMPQPKNDTQPVTKKDLRHTQEVLRGEMRALVAELRADLLEKMNDQTRTIFIGQLASSITLGALLIAAVKL